MLIVPWHWVAALSLSRTSTPAVLDDSYLPVVLNITEGRTESLYWVESASTPNWRFRPKPAGRALQLACPKPAVQDRNIGVTAHKLKEQNQRECRQYIYGDIDWIRAAVRNMAIRTQQSGKSE
jgi:hypothetical protein